MSGQAEAGGTKNSNTSIRHFLAALVIWSVIVGGSLWWNFRNAEEQTMREARHAVMTVRDKDMAFRQWALKHGGVYVPVTQDTQPAESLAHVPGRDVTTEDGLQLTLRAPAIMVREMMDLYFSSNNVRGRITGLRYLNPVNAPDEWEKAQLERFARGEQQEVFEIDEINGQPYLRYLQAWHMSEGCMKCHAILGYEVGELRGATGANLPMAEHFSSLKVARSNLLLTHGGIWLLGLMGIGFSGMLVKRREEQLSELNASLENRINERTADLAAQNLHNASIVNAAMDGFFMTDLEGKILDCNAAYCEMLGYTRAEMLQLYIPQIEAQEDPAEVAMHIGKVMTEGCDRFDTRHRQKHGGLLDVEVNVSLVDVWHAHRLYVFVHDITSRKTHEAALVAARHAAEQASAAKSEFLSRMSHELRTPLNAIIGFAQMMVLPDKSPLTVQQADSVQEILKAGQHLLLQVNEVLDLARIESGRIELSLEPLLLAPLVKDCVAQVQPLAAARGITIAAQLDAAVALQGDTTRVKQVLLNLLSNAIKYNRDGGQIHVAAVAAGEQRRVEIRDTGRGISPEQRARLFKPFERLESSYDGIEGTGIGLALVKRLVEAMGGEIGVDSEEGVGSTFWFVLPVASLPSLPDAALPGGTAITTDVAKASQHCVLYIEDNPANLKLMRKILGLRAELLLLEANSAAFGLEVARSQHPDLIFLDINLPEMDGFAVLAALQADSVTRNIPVVAVTANAMKRDLERGMAAGFAEYLTKPIDFARLNQILDDLLAGERR